MKVGINGAVRDISDLKVGVSGAVRAVSEAYIGVNGAVKKVWPIIFVGYQEILDTVGKGTWVCPATGTWEVEMHGGGGGGALSRNDDSYFGGAGGGSGEVYTLNLEKGTSHAITIGRGGREMLSYSGAPDSGGDTTFGDYTVKGGESGSYWGSGGYRSGSLATSGQSFTYSETPPSGGKGNKNNPSQIYGNGGDGGRIEPVEYAQSGEDGAIILTYLG